MIQEQNLDVKDLTNASRVRQVLSRVKKNGNRYIVTENGEPLALLLPLEGSKPKKLDKEKAWQELFKLVDSVHARNAQIPLAEVEADVDAAIREVRRKRK
jgi:antitoxin (DNA-binding transcriptional repressor) of toxin-antitoxin stability system